MDFQTLHARVAAAATATTSASASASTTASSSQDGSSRPPVFKAVGIILAVSSGLLIGISYVLKKVGLLRANVKYNEEAGEGYGYLKNAFWWGGMTLMILGELCNFVAYAFVDAILVTPMGALSVVVTTILSAIFLKERLSFVGKVGCFSCIIGSVVIALNAPTESSVSTIQDMQHYVVAPGFLSYAGAIIVGCAFVAFWAGPRYGKKSMFVYISVCSLIGGLSVVATQGLGAAIVTQIQGQEQFKHWFLYVLFVFVVITLLVEIVYLNKALNIYNAALVTPTYYVLFTTSTIVTSAVLFRGFKGTAISITTLVMGFLQICTGVVLLQLSKSAKDVPDAAVFKGDLDQVREVAEQEEPEYEPKADAIRGTAAIVRSMSSIRHKSELEEAKRYHEERKLDENESLAEGEVIEWDGLRRRKTLLGPNGSVHSRPSTLRSSNTSSIRHPPLGMSRIPESLENEAEKQPDAQSSSSSGTPNFLSNISQRAYSLIHPGWSPLDDDDNHNNNFGNTTKQSQVPGSSPKPGQNSRQFSFRAMLPHSDKGDPTHHQPLHVPSTLEKKARSQGTEEETMGLVEGDNATLSEQRPTSSHTQEASTGDNWSLSSNSRPQSIDDAHLRTILEYAPSNPATPSAGIPSAAESISNKRDGNRQ